MKTTLIFLFLFINFCIEGTLPPAAFSFLVVDLKYSEERGISFCELQPLTYSAFRGYDFLHQSPGLVAKRTCDFFEQFGHTIYVHAHSFSEQTIVDEMVARNFTTISSLGKLHSHPNFIESAEKEVEDPDNLSSYHALVVAKPKFFNRNVKEFKEIYPNVLVLDECFFPCWLNKLKISKLFLDIPEIAHTKPSWKLYTKETSKRENKKSDQAFTTEYVVLKPLSSAKGNGVIILERKDLPKTIEMIRSQSKELKYQQDPAYQYWKYKSQKPFVVEEFHYSDPIEVPHLNNRKFDPTLRAAFVLWYEHGEVFMDFIEMHWKLPQKDLKEEGTFTEKHKSYASKPYYALVHPEKEEVIKQALRETIPLIYLKLLEDQ